MSPTTLYRRPARTTPAADHTADLAERLARNDARSTEPGGEDVEFWTGAYRKALTLTDRGRFTRGTAETRRLTVCRLAAAGMRL